MAQRVKCLPAMRETWVRSLGREDPLEKEMETHSSTLTWKIPWTEEPSRLQSMELQRVGHDWVTLLSIYIYIYEVGISIFQIRKLKLEEIRSNCYKQLKWKTKRKNSPFMRVSVHESNITSKWKPDKGRKKKENYTPNWLLKLQKS